MKFTLSEGVRHTRLRIRVVLAAFSLVIIGLFIKSIAERYTSSPRSGSYERDPQVQNKVGASNPKLTVPAIHSGLANSTFPQLRLLSEHEQRLGRGFDQMMFFRDIPKTQEAAIEQAAYTANILKEYDRQNIEPLVIFEPEGTDIRYVDPGIFGAFFRALQANGIDNDSIGHWVLFPEPNIPEWSTGDDTGNTNPEIFKANFMKAAFPLKVTFPDAKTVILLNAATYKSYDVDYKQTASYDPDMLLKYVSGLPPNLADIACLQGFPWAPDDFEPEGGFLDADLAIALAKEISTKKVRLNTGTFGRMYDITVSPEQRSNILDRIMAQADQIKKAGFDVTIDSFMEDKYDVTENADWSYATPADWTVFERFVRSVEQKGINLTIFDQ